FDITAALQKTGNQEIAVRVWGPSDEGPQPRGKQVKKPNSIWYTPVTGIWQTVWLEAVPKTYISVVKQTPDVDKSAVRVAAHIVNDQPGDQVVVSAWKGNQKVAEQTVAANEEVVLPVTGAALWSPRNPFL